MTEIDVKVPSDYVLQGVSVHENFEQWIEEHLAPLIEQHNADNIIDEWAVPDSAGLDHLTIALAVDDQIIITDLLHNTTSWKSNKIHHLFVNHRIHSAICAFERKAFVLPPTV